MAAKKPKHPMQPIVLDGYGLVRFSQNEIVNALLDHSAKHGCGLNDIMERSYDVQDRMQFLQLLGITVGTYGDMGVDKKSYRKASRKVEKLPRKVDTICSKSSDDST